VRPGSRRRLSAVRGYKQYEPIVDTRPQRSQARPQARALRRSRCCCRCMRAMAICTEATGHGATSREPAWIRLSAARLTTIPRVQSAQRVRITQLPQADSRACRPQIVNWACAPLHRTLKPKSPSQGVAERDKDVAQRRLQATNHARPKIDGCDDFSTRMPHARAQWRRRERQRVGCIAVPLREFGRNCVTQT
jgi:hypothetical protein